MKVGLLLLGPVKAVDVAEFGIEQGPSD